MSEEKKYTELDYRMELYEKLLGEPTNTKLTGWWDNLHPDAKLTIPELYTLNKEFQVINPDIEKPNTLVEQTLKQEKLNPDLFTTKSTMLGDGKPFDVGVIKVNPDGSREVINDKSILEALNVPDYIPQVYNPEILESMSKKLKKKEDLITGGYKLIDIASNSTIEKNKPKLKETTNSRGKYTSTLRSIYNKLLSSKGQYEIASDFMNAELGYDPEQRFMEIAEEMQFQKGLNYSEAYTEFMEETDTVEWLKKWGLDPIEISIHMAVEQLGMFIPAILESATYVLPKTITAGAMYGSAGGPGGALLGGKAGLIAGASSSVGLASFSLEYTNKMMESFEEMGVDLTDGQQLYEAFQDEEKMSGLRGVASRKGLPPAIFDTISAGIAGRLYKGASKLWGVAKELGAQMFLGGAGEAGGQALAGEDWDMKAIIAEMAMEPIIAVPSGMVNISTQVQKKKADENFKKTTSHKVIEEARESGEFDNNTLKMAEILIKRNPEVFEEKSTLEFINDIRTVTQDQLRRQGIDPQKFFEGQGLDPNTPAGRVLGRTLEEDGNILVSLYKGANADTVVEEFYGNHFKRLSEEDLKVWNEYYKKYMEGGGKRTPQELFERNGKNYFWDEKLFQEDTAFKKLMRKIKEMFNSVFLNVEQRLDPAIAKMYRDAGLGRMGQEVKKGESFQMIDAEGKTVLYSKMRKVIDDIPAKSLKARGLKNYLSRFGVTKDEMNAWGIDDFLTEYKPTDSISKSDLQEWGDEAETVLSERSARNGDVDIDSMDDWTYPEEQRWDIFTYGGNWRDEGMYAEDAPPGFSSRQEAEWALSEEAQYIAGEEWYDIDREESDEFKIVQAEGNKWGIESDGELIMETVSDDKNELEAKFLDWREDNLQNDPDWGVEEFTWVDEEGELVPPENYEGYETRHSEHQQPGPKENYEELVITLDFQPGQQGTFRADAHWDFDNPLVHTRFNTRYDKDGNKVLFVEEIQSDWHQQGAQKGYRKPIPEDVMSKVNNLRKELKNKRAQIGSDLTKDRQLKNEIQELNTEIAFLLEPYGGPVQLSHQPVPDAPFKDFKYIDLMLKRLLNHASVNNFDKISFITGKQQADRWNLRKYIDRIEYRKNPSSDNTYFIQTFDKQGRKILNLPNTIKEDELVDYFGKGISNKIVSGAKDGSRSISLDDVQGVSSKMNYHMKPGSGAFKNSKIKVKFFNPVNVNTSPDMINFLLVPVADLAGSHQVRLKELYYKWMEGADRYYNKMERDVEQNNSYILQKARKWMDERKEEYLLLAREVALEHINNNLKGLTNEIQYIKDAGLESGGDFHIQLYDNIIPNKLAKLVKGTGGKLSTVELETNPAITAGDKGSFSDNRRINTHKSVTINDKTRDKFSQPVESFQMIPEGAYDAMNDTVLGYERAIVPISTRLKRINPKLKRRLRDFEYAVINNSNIDRTKVLPFIEKMAKKFRLSGINDEKRTDWNHLDLALKNSDEKTVNRLIKKYDLVDEYKEVRKTLDDVYKRAKKAGIDLGHIDKYFPRSIKHGSHSKVTGRLTIEAQGILTKEIKKAEVELGRELDVAEKSIILNTLISRHSKVSFKTSHEKRRKIKTLDHVLNLYYEDSSVSLLNYLNGMNEAIEVAKFYGKGKDKIDSIGSYVSDLIEKGEITAEQEQEVYDILRARFQRGKSGKLATNIKNATYILTMGNPYSAITQIGDLAWAINEAGLYRSLKAFGKSTLSQVPGINFTRIERDQLIDRIGSEFENVEGMANVVDNIFKAVQINRIDKIGKESLINASLEKYQSQAKKNSPALLRKLDEVFGDKSAQVLEDLKSGEVTENVKMLVFNTLLDYQPVTLSEMPQYYLESGGGGKLMYQLKTFTIKQLDVFRNQIFDEIKTGYRTGDKARVVKAMGNLIRTAGIFATVNAGSDAIKDWLLGREWHLDESSWDQFYRLIGISRYITWKARIEGPGTALWQLPTPAIVSVINTVGQDVDKAFLSSSADEQERAEKAGVGYESIKYFPFVGKRAFWLGEAGQKKVADREIKRYRNFLKERPLTSAEENKLLFYTEKALDNEWITDRMYDNILTEAGVY